MHSIFADRRVRRGVGLLISLSPLLVLLLALSPAVPAQADNVTVGDGVNPSSCNMFTLGAAMNTHTGADITFACGGPATVVITQSGGLDIFSGQAFTIDGTDVITISGIDQYRLFDVQGGGALTLTHIILDHGYAASGGNFPTQGGAVLNEGATLVLDHATVRDSRAAFAAGAIEDSGGTTLLKDSLIENNQSTYGGGIDSLGALTLVNTTVRANQAITGGGLDVGGTVVISASQMYSNSANLAGGGVRVTNTGLVTIDGSQLYLNHPVTTTLSSLGGAIANDGVLTITHTDLYSNTSFTGGSLYNNFSGRLVLINSTVNSNSANEGGGIYNSATGHVALTDTTVSGNSAYNGGGIYNFLVATATLEGVTFDGNSATAQGGGIYNTGHVPTISHSTLSGNLASQGGGIYNLDQIQTISYSTLSGNSASQGGGIYSNSDFLTTTVSHSTLNGNSANEGGRHLQPGSISGCHRLHFEWQFSADPRRRYFQLRGGQYPYGKFHA